MGEPGSTRKETTQASLEGRARQRDLSRQEARVVELAMAGMIDKEIAEAMGISLGTVRVYWKRVRAKSGATRAESIAGLARRDSEDAGERAARTYEAVLRAMGVAFATIDGEGRTLRAEAAFATLLGAGEAELVGSPIAAWIPGLAELPASTEGKPVPIRARDGWGRDLDLRLLGERASILVVWAENRGSGGV